jgi:hypothetical protein
MSSPKNKWDALNEKLKRLQKENRKLNMIGSKLIRCLDFYANPETYFAVAFIHDPPSGDFMNDFSKTNLGYKPGKRARKVLDKIMSMYENENKS